MYITLIKDGGEKMVKNIKKTLQIIAICVCTLTFSIQSITIADEQDEAFDGGDTYAIQDEDYNVWVKDIQTGCVSEETYSSKQISELLEAEPFIPTNSGSTSIRQIIGSDDRYTTASNSEEYRHTCYILSIYEDGSAVGGTGFLIGPNTVATSAHVICNGKFASTVKVYLESKNQTDSNKIANGVQMIVGSVDTNNIKNGWGLIELDKPLGNTAGYYGFSAAGSVGKDVILTGFHGDKDVMSTSKGKITDIQNNVLYHNCDMISGASGSPIYESSGMAYGVNYGSYAGNNLATYIDINLFEHFNSARVQYSLSEQGYLDSVSTDEIKGWAFNPESRYDSKRVDIYVYDSNGKLHDSGPTSAKKYRPDVGLHGFSYPISWLKYQPGEYKVYAYVIGVWGGNPLLKNSPKSYNVRQSTGTVDYVNSSGIGGWVWKPDAPNDAIEAHVYFYDADTGSLLYGKAVKADTYRADLYRDGRGNGKHGFSFSVDWKQWGVKRIKVETYSVDNSGYNPKVSSKIYTVE